MAGERPFEIQLDSFLENRCYQTWVHDSQIRDTGPFLDNKNFGTHPAVKVFYSPEVWSWLQGDREGAIPTGGVIVKEMFRPPASTSTQLTGWTVMVKDAAASKDGWYWGYHGPGEPPEKPIEYPDSGFGLYCIRCHASAESELTFASLRNVQGSPLTFTVQLPTMTPEAMKQHLSLHERVAATTETPPLEQPHAQPDPAFSRLFGISTRFSDATIAGFALPPETFDHVLSGANGPETFLTSDQCLGCHTASSVNMAYPFADPARPPVNLSPYTEWRASLMGLAGRDPVFHAQLAWEKSNHPEHTAFFDQTCYRCHGVMGLRQIEIDQRGPFEHSMVYALPGSLNAKYGALARDGVSCAVCHHIAAEGLGTVGTFTGSFKVGPSAELYGPYLNVVVLPMQTALGITPKQGTQISSAALCGSCHTVILPVFDRAGNKLKEIYEQTTYLEWRNSVYQNESAPIVASEVKTCQDCHMPQTYDGRKLTYRIANVEDASYPAADHRAADASITPVPRDSYSRHQLMGINVFSLALVRQFAGLLGIRTADYMYDEGVPGLETAHQTAMQFARNETARIEVQSVERRRDSLDVHVHVTNLAGHGLPSGVEFRRVFIEMKVLDGHGRILWASGRTSPLGVILEGVTDKPLRTEFMIDPDTGKTTFQSHHEIVTREDQVQTYEELVANPEGRVSSSFVGLNQTLKDNRLLPRGWRRDGPDAEKTTPVGDALRDPDYANGSGSDSLIYRIPLSRAAGATRVEATLYYQSLPPYYLHERLAGSKGREIERLAYMASRLNVESANIEGWKLKIASAAHEVSK